MLVTNHYVRRVQAFDRLSLATFFEEQGDIDTRHPQCNDLITAIQVLPAFIPT